MEWHDHCVMPHHVAKKAWRKSLFASLGWVLALCGAALLAGCQAMALSAVGAGATSGIERTLNGVGYRTFTATGPQVKSAALRALTRMGIRPLAPAPSLASADKSNPDVVRASAADRDIELEFEILASNATRLRVKVKSGLFYDAATAIEILRQTERMLQHT